MNVEDLPVHVRFSDITLRFAGTTTLKDVRDAFNCSGGFLTSEGVADPTTIASPHTQVPPGRYRLVMLSHLSTKDTQVLPALPALLLPEDARARARKVIVEQMDMHKEQLHKYQELATFYFNWKSKRLELPQAMKFPVLPTLPKECPDPRTTNFLIREETMKIFDEIYTQWYENTSNSVSRYGRYLAGPYGIGKSISLYQISCLARAVGFIVVYVPNCDIWCSQPSELLANTWFLLELTRGLLDHLNETQVFGPKDTWHDLLITAWAARDIQNTKMLTDMIGIILEQLCVYTAKPVLLCFDEVNALFTHKLNWLPQVTPREIGFFTHASNLNTTPLQRGLKLLSGTGHQEYLLYAPPGTLRGYTIYLEPWSDTDFKSLAFTVNCLLLSDWLKIENVAHGILNLIILFTGTIPRELRQLTIFIEQSLSKELPDAAMVRRNQNPFDQMKSLLTRYKDDTLLKLMPQLSSYLRRVEKPQVFLKNILDSLLGFSTDPISGPFLDLSVMYWKADLRQYLPTSPLAAQALVALVKNGFDPYSAELNSTAATLVDTSIEADERSRAFERIIATTLLLDQQISVLTTKLDGTDAREEILRCSVAKKIERTISPTKVVLPTLLVPSIAQFPAADLILVSPEECVVLQITFQAPRTKIPYPDTSYSMIYNTTKYKSILGAKQVYHFPQGETFGEALLQLTDFPARVTGPEILGVCDLREGNVAATHIKYIVISSQPVNSSPESVHLAQRFPWVRVIDRSNLHKLLPKAVVNLLPH